MTFAGRRNNIHGNVSVVARGKGYKGKFNRAAVVIKRYVNP